MSYQCLLDIIDVRKKQYISPKGFKLENNEYLIVIKERGENYDYYTFEFTGLEYHKLLDQLQNSEEK